MSVENKKTLGKLLPVLLVIVVLILTGGLVFLLKDWIDGADVAPPKRVQTIKLIAPPPPPPPPPEDEPPPEPEVEEEIDQPEEDMPEEAPDDAPPAGADLGVDADGGAGSDGFGLVGRKGGRGLLDGSPFAYYEGLMVSEIQDVLSEIEDLKSEEYRFRIKIAVAFDGTIESVKLIKSTGDKEKDKLLLSALRGFDKFSKMPPGKMPPVVDLRITSSI